MEPPRLLAAARRAQAIVGAPLIVASGYGRVGGGDVVSRIARRNDLVNILTTQPLIAKRFIQQRLGDFVLVDPRVGDSRSDDLQAVRVEESDFKIRSKKNGIIIVLLLCMLYA